jgi:hypothetical protein
VSNLISTVLSMAASKEDKEALQPLAPIDSRDLQPSDIYAEDLHTLLYQLGAISEILGALRYSIMDQPVAAKDFDEIRNRLEKAQTLLRNVIFEKFRRRA